MADDGKNTGSMPTGRWQRMLKLGGTATSVGARQAFHKLKEAVGGPQAGAQQAVNSHTAQQVAKTLSEMKGAAMKVGQMLSMDPNLLPPEFREALGILQKDAPPMPFDVVEKQVSTALGKPLAEAFREFDRQPMGAASIGQVHRAVANDGTPLAVKVQYPGVADSIDSDIQNLGSLLNMARVALPNVNVEEYLEEFRQVLHREADYTQEAASLDRFGKVFSVFDFVRVPRAFPDLTRRNVLSMEFMEGRKMDEWLLELPQTERNAWATRFMGMFFRSFHEMHTLHADPHPGNFLVDRDGRLVLLDFGCIKDFEPAFTAGFARILKAHWTGDAEALPERFRAAGFGVPDARKLPPDVLYEYLDLLLAPFIKDTEFDFTHWDVEWKAKDFVTAHPAMLSLTPPRDALFYFRVCAGLKGMLCRTGSRVNVHRLARDQEKRLKTLGLLEA